ncbi:MAG: hypothetical protein AMXMBFR33_30030 [Candidatus Xenobia bacterium]
MQIDFSYRRRFRWPWQDAQKSIDQSQAERHLDKGRGDRLSVRLAENGPLVPLPTRADLQELQAFQEGRPPDGKPELGQALLDLARGGWSFHGAAGQIGLYGAYNALTDPAFAELGSAVARKDRSEVPLDPERTVRMANFYNGNSLNARLESEGYQFFSQGEQVAGFVAGPQVSLGKNGQLWLEGPLPPEPQLRDKLQLFQQLVSEAGAVSEARDALAVVESQASPEQKAREMMQLQSPGLNERALGYLAESHPLAAEVTRVAMQAAGDGFELLEQACQDPNSVGLGQKLARHAEDPEVARALLEAQKQKAPELVKLGGKLLEQENTEPVATAVALLDELERGKSSTRVELARKQLAAGADPQVVMSTQRKTPGWEAPLTFYERAHDKLSYTESASALAAALVSGPAPDKTTMLQRVQTSLASMDDQDRETLVETALRHLDPESKPAVKLARDLEQPELALTTSCLKTGQDVLAMGRQALQDQETLSEEAGAALLQALEQYRDTRELGKQASALTAELSLEATHYVLDQLLNQPGDLLTRGSAILNELRTDESPGNWDDPGAFAHALLGQLARNPAHKALAERASKLSKAQDSEDFEIAYEGLAALTESRSLESFLAACVGRGVDETLERTLHGKPVFALYRKLSDECPELKEPLLEGALLRPEADSKELVGLALKAVPHFEASDEQARQADLERLAEQALDMLKGPERKLAQQLTEGVEPGQHWAALQPLLLGPAPTNLDELARLGGEVTSLSKDPELAANLLLALSSYPESASGRQLVAELCDATEGDVRSELTRALCANPRASSPHELARIGAQALEHLSEFPDEAGQLAESLLQHFETEPTLAVGLARELTDLDPAQVAGVVLSHPLSDSSGLALGRVALELSRRTESLEPVGAALVRMAEQEDTRLAAPTALQAFEGMSEESAKLLADSLLGLAHDPGALAVTLRAAADRGETAGDEEPEQAYAYDTDVLRESATRLEAIALTSQTSSTQIEQRGAQVVVGGVPVAVRR